MVTAMFPLTDPPQVPVSPIPLRAAAAAKWAELATGPRPKPWSTAEHAQLAAYCAAYGRWFEAESRLAGAGGPIVTISDDKGNIKSHGPAPEIAVAVAALKEMARLAKILRIR